jgi:hypothetical protein
MTSADTGHLLQVDVRNKKVNLQSVKQFLEQIERNTRKIGYYVIRAGLEQHWSCTVAGDTDALHAGGFCCLNTRN